MAHPLPHSWNRRGFLRAALLAAGLPPLGVGCSARPGVGAGAGAGVAMMAPDEVAAPAAPLEVGGAGSGLFPAPDLSEANILRFVAGVRPYRTGRVRLEAERMGERLLVHNYGHGGAGVTLAWGCAHDIVRMVAGRPSPGSARDAPVAVLGAGVIGLTAAHELLRAGHPVTIYAAETLERTTSWLAGAQWAPSLVSRGDPPGDAGRFDRLIRTSHARFAELAGTGGWGVHHRPNFVCGGGGGLRHIPEDLIPPARRLDPLPLAGVSLPGEVYETMLIEPPVFLPRLTREIETRGGVFRQRRFAGLEELASLPEGIIVNCLGLGAGPLFGDSRLVPIRGQLVHLRPQDLPYLLSHSDGYLFPRTDALVLGGTIERGVDDGAADERACLGILRRHQRFFGAAALPG